MRMFLICLSLLLGMTSCSLMISELRKPTEFKIESLVTKEPLVRKVIEVYSCGSKLRYTCKDYIFIFKNNVYKVGQQTYYLNNIGDLVSLEYKSELPPKKLIWLSALSLILFILFVILVALPKEFE